MNSTTLRHSATSFFCISIPARLGESAPDWLRKKEHLFNVISTITTKSSAPLCGVTHLLWQSGTKGGGRIPILTSGRTEEQVRAWLTRIRTLSINVGIRALMTFLRVDALKRKCASCTLSFECIKNGINNGKEPSSIAKQKRGLLWSQLLMTHYAGLLKCKHSLSRWIKTSKPYQTESLIWQRSNLAFDRTLRDPCENLEKKWIMFICCIYILTYMYVYT